MRALTLPVLFIATLLAAQTGPGGVGSSATNVIWLSADQGVYNNAGTTFAGNGDNVRQWNDRSGNARHAGEANVANRPNLATAVLNGRPVVRFTAANNDRLISTGLTTADQASAWVVTRYTSLPSPNPGLLQGAASGNALAADAALKNLGMWVSSSNTRPWGRGIRSDGTMLEISQTTNTSAGTFYILNNNYGASQIQQYINNSAAGSVATNGTLRSWTDLCVGMQAGSEGWNGDIAEVILFNTALNATQRLVVANYLAAKYGLTLGTGDLYTQDNPGAGNHDHDVAGIGRTSSSDMHTAARGSGHVLVSKAAHSGLQDNEFLLWGHDGGALGTWGVGDLPSGVQGRWQRVWRVSEVNASGSSVNVGDVDMSFDLSDLGAVTASHLRLLVDTDNDGLFADETPISGAVNDGGGMYRFAAVSALQNGRRFTLGTSNLSSTPLPVELLHFTADPAGPASVRLSWATASEHNNAGFTVERSKDLHTWTTVAHVTGAGDAQTTLNYDAMDHQAPPALLYYRLRQIDLDGSSLLSATVSVDLRHSAIAVLVPNPADGPVDLVLAPGAAPVLGLDLVDGSGRVLPLAPMPNGNDRWRFDVSMLAPGAYVVRVHQAGDKPPGQLRLLR
ncbi:MAG: hypothetical protein IT227_07250 [Flavobacteriales bacterium]|nr:hypothetical protein [Flavobacteriales bacterium]